MHYLLHDSHLQHGFEGGINAVVAVDVIEKVGYMPRSVKVSSPCPNKQRALKRTESTTGGKCTQPVLSQLSRYADFKMRRGTPIPTPVNGWSGQCKRPNKYFILRRDRMGDILEEHFVTLSGHCR